MIDIRLVAIVACVVVACLAAMTALALKGLVSAAVVSGAATGIISAFVGWLVPQPRKEKQE